VEGKWPGWAYFTEIDLFRLDFLMLIQMNIGDSKKLSTD
jgi:hypothetical protein